MTLVRPLLERVPGLRDRIAWQELCRLPTPVRRLEALSALPPGGDVWLKDDSVSSPGLGGNKARILETVLPDALARSQRPIALGPVSSNWVRALVMHAHAAGVPAEAILFRWPAGETSAESLRQLHLIASHVTVCATPLGLPWAILRRLWARGVARGLVLPPGGASALGVLAYVNAALELGDDIASGRLPAPARLYVPFGSGATASGLALGLALLDSPIEVVAVRVTDRILASMSRLRRLMRRAAALLVECGAAPVPLERVKVRVLHDHFGGRYGRATTAGAQAVALGATDGLQLENTYSGKALGAALAERDGRPLVFWNTAGRKASAPGSSVV